MTTDPSIYMQFSLSTCVEDATSRYACWYSLDGEQMVGKQALAGGDWTTHQITGTARLALDMPLDEDDTHNLCSLGIDSIGRLHLMSNMHNDDLHYVRQNTLGNITSWTASTLPGVGETCTYPTFVHRPDGSLRVYMRDVGWTGRGDGHVWTHNGTSWSSPTLLFQGLSVPNAKGAGIPGDPFSAGDTLYNWNPYPAFAVTGGPTDWIEHWFVIFREDDTGILDDPADRHNVKPSYVQYRSATDSWHAVTGETVTPPFDPVNQTVINTNLEANPDQPPGSEGYINSVAMAIKDDGYPHVILSQGPWYRIVYTEEDGWVQTRMGNALPSNSWQLNGYSLISRVDPVFLKGEIWYSGTAYSSGGAVVRPRLWKTNGTSSVSMGGDVGNSWCVAHSDLALMKRGVVERFTPDGDVPFVTEFGGGTKMATL